MSFMPYKYCADRHRKSYRWRSCCSVKNITTSNPTNFVLKQKLYHYTTLERAISILSSNKLFMGKLAGMNDINESYRPLSSYIEDGDSSNTESQKKLEAAESQLKRIRQTSLSMDDETPGFAIPAMWGHYADKGEGICIVFDKELLLNKLKRTGGFHFKPVTYETNFNPCITIREDPERFFQQHMEDIFFKKSDDWKCEQEFRIICLSDNPAYVDISGCVVALIMCYAKGQNKQDACFGSEAHNKLHLLFPDYPILEWATGICGSNLLDKDGNQWYPKANSTLAIDV